MSTNEPINEEEDEEDRKCLICDLIPPGPGQESVWEYPRPPRLELSKELEHARPPLSGVVELDVQVGDALEPKRPAELVADERHRPAQRRDRLRPLLRLADHAHPHLRMAQVGRRLDLGDRREPDARIRDVPGNDAADLLPQVTVLALQARQLEGAGDEDGRGAHAALRLEGDGRVQRVVLGDGQTLACDFAVAAVGWGVRIAAVPRMCILRFALALPCARCRPAGAKVPQPPCETGHCVLLSSDRP